ncbi:MAG: MotA/TolQ/ExbB proton channel family protein, partial [Alphaproteobacteria bacterium]|nr:MotA/TolQ/ExbB proton channel family protein [Alphaproteobacteria bacterium]
MAAFDIRGRFPPETEALLAPLLNDGGLIVAGLLILSVAALTVAIYKLVQFLITGVGRDQARTRKAVSAWRAGYHDEARQIIVSTRGARAALVRAAMDAGCDPRRPSALVREDIESRALAHLAALRSYLRVLEATAQLAPLIGLFGT